MDPAKQALEEALETYKKALVQAVADGCDDDTLAYWSLLVRRIGDALSKC